MNKPIVFILGFLLGAFVTGVGAYLYGGRALLWGAYMEAAADVRGNVAVLRELDAGNTERARDYVSRFLLSNESVLNGCKNDLCSGQSIPDVDEALKLVEAYRANARNTDP